MKKSEPVTKPTLMQYKRLARLLMVVIVVLTITAGYYYQVNLLEAKKYKRLEDQFVRVRSQLGVEKTNQLIENSYLEPNKTVN